MQQLDFRQRLTRERMPRVFPSARQRLANVLESTLPKPTAPPCHAAFAAARREVAHALVRSVVTVGLALGAAGPASAAVYYVTRTADDTNPGSLRSAVQLANYNAGSTVQFDSSLNGSTITLASQIAIQAAMTIQGPGSDKLTISGNNATRLFSAYTTGFTPLNVTMSGLKLTAGNSSKGGAVYSKNIALTLQDVLVTGNTGTNGGAVYATSGSVTLTRATISANSATFGAGLFLFGSTSAQFSDSVIDGNTASFCCGGSNFSSVGTVTINNTSITNNHANNGNGGGLAADYSPMQIVGSTISGNTVAGSAKDGGGLWIHNGNATISGTQLSNNTASYFGGALYMHDARGTPTAVLDVENCAISGNTAQYRGGGISANRLSSLTIGYSLLNGNQTNAAFAGGGGGAGLSVGYLVGPTQVHDSTFYGNNSVGPGGGLDILGTTSGNATTLTSVTVVGNATSSAYASNGVRAAGTPTIDSSIVANNTNANAGSQDLLGTFTVKFSDVKKKGTATFAAGSGNNLADGTDPSLGLLAANGGPTKTLLPNAGSPVIDKGDTAIVSGIDQRGLPRVVNARADMGAVEVGGSVTTLVSSLNPSTFGQNVTFTATVSGVSPTGTVTFKDGATVICSNVALSSASAGCSTSSLTAGTHSITATYNGDANNSTSTSSPLSQVVNQATTSTALGSSVNPSTFGQNVTFTATVSGQSPTGNVTFKDGATTLCSAVALSGTSAGCSTSTLSIASHSITATYNGDSNNTGSTSNTVTQVVNKATTSTALVSSVNPSTFGQNVTFTATVTGQSPTGNVTFKDGATAICSNVALSSGSAACSKSNLTVASHSITAVYNGDSSNATSTSNTVTQVVNKATSTTALASSVNPSTFGQNVTFTATVTGQAPTGNVTFNDGATAICSNVALSGGSAACTKSNLSVATHSITATYNGDGNNATSTSNTVSQVVNKATSSTALVSSVNPSTFGQNVTFTATVTGQAPTGNVTFNDGATAICSNVALSGATAACSSSTLSVASHSITATYNGDGNNATSTSNTVSQVVNKATSSTALVSSVNPSTFGQNVTFTATVTGQSPSGNVTFKDGATAICTNVALSSGSAGCSTSTLSVASHSITAVYNGDSNNATSTSNTVTQVVNKASSSTALVSSVNPSAFGQNVTFTATVTGQSPSGNVTFKDGATTLCSAVTLSAGSAGCSTSTLSVASHPITATYNGDGNNATSTSNTVSQIVNNSTSSTALVSSVNPSTFGQNVTFTATVTGQSPTGNVTFNDGATAICSNVALSGASAGCSTSTLSVASHSISATYNGDGNNASSTSNTVSQVVNKATSSTALVSSVNPSTFGQNVTFTATVTGQSPTGNVTFKDGATAICSNVALSGASAGCSTSTLSVAAHSITATYNGDGNNTSSTSNTVSQVVNKATSSTALGSSVNPSTFGQNVTFTATVTGQSPSGNVTFNDGATAICTNVALSSGSAACSISTLSVALHSISATYNGDGNNASSTSNTVSQVVNKATSSTALVSSVNPSTFGQNVTFTATVTGQSPSGNVTFNDGATAICTNVALSSGSAGCSTSTLSVASHSITAVYNGDGNNATSTSNTVSQVVNKATSNTALASSVNPSTFSQNVTFTATVTGQSPIGNVTFNDGATAICTNVALSSGSAGCSTSTLSVASHSITATYNGDGNNAGSTSNIVTQVVNKATSSTALVSSVNPSTFGQNVTFTATVTGQSPSGNVTFNDGASAICTNVALSSGSAGCSTSTLGIATHPVTATYNGDGNNASSTSNTVSQVVNKVTSNTTLGSSVNPSLFGQNVTFTAAVAGQSPTGNVTFNDGPTAICTNVALSSGSAGCSTSTLSVATHSITATYGGDSNNAASTSNTVTQVVNASVGDTTTVLSTACMTTFVESQPFTLAATVFGASPTGTATFKDGVGNIYCASVPLSAGSASCTTSGLSVQGGGNEFNYDLVAAYGGDASNNPSVSSTLAVTVLSAADVISRSSFEPGSLNCPIE
jgi:predicted outer membrane repeat protein